MARPSEYTKDACDLICSFIAEGKSLRTICLSDDAPSKATVFRWLASHPEFRDQYAHAREAQADALAEEILDISDDGSNDWTETEDGPKLDNEHVQRSRLRVDSRKWLASKLKPKKYGDKLAHTGPEGEGPVSISVTWQSGD